MPLFLTSDWSHALISAFSGDVVDPIHFPPPPPARPLPPAAHRSAAAAPSLALRPLSTSPSSPHLSEPATNMTAHRTPALQPLLTQQVIAKTTHIILETLYGSTGCLPLFQVLGAGESLQIRSSNAQVAVIYQQPCSRQPCSRLPCSRLPCSRQPQPLTTSARAARAVDDAGGAGQLPAGDTPRPTFHVHIIELCCKAPV